MPVSDPSPANEADGSDVWLELLVEGLTFDLLGLAPGPGSVVPEIAHRFSCASDIEAGAVEAIGLVPGPHIAPGAHTLPVVRTLARLGAALAEALPNTKALMWAPARAAIGRPFFIRTVSAWLAGGTFPARGLVAFDASGDGTLRTEGLDFFIGQELKLAQALGADRVAGTRLAARLVHELVALGQLSHPLEITIEDGIRLLLDPGEDGLIRVSSL